MDMDTYNRLVHGAYDGVLSPQGWRPLLEDIRVLTESVQSTIVVYQPSHNRTLIADINCPDAAMMRDYESTYAATDPGRPHVAALGLGEWYIDDEKLGAAKHSYAFYHDFLNPYGMDALMCASLANSPDTLAGLSLQAGYGREGYAERHIAMLAPLMPHLIRATAMRMRYHQLSQQAQLGHHLLDRLALPLLVVNFDAKVLYANNSGESWLKEKGNMFTSRVHERDEPVSRKVRELAREICGEGALTALTVTTDPDARGERAVMVGLPLALDHPVAAHFTQRVGVVLIHAAARTCPTRSHILRQLYRLSPAETRLVEALDWHDTLSDAADAMGLSRETVRAQIKAVFRKTGCRNQSALARLVTELDLFYRL